MINLNNVIYFNELITTNSTDALISSGIVNDDLLQTIKIEQQNDNTMRSLVDRLKSDSNLNSNNSRSINKYYLNDNQLLCDNVFITSLINKVLSLCHDSIGGGHLGFHKTWSKVKTRFVWNNMYLITRNWVNSCSTCAAKKQLLKTKMPLIPLKAAEKPFELVGVDVLGPLPITKQGHKYIVVFTDYLTKWVEAFPVAETTANTIAKLLINEIIARHSAPIRLLSDQGRNFLSQVVKEVCNMFEIQKINTTAYHPQTNGLTERFNKALCTILSVYVNKYQNDWDEFLSWALFTYRVSEQNSTKFSPFELLYNRKARLPSNLDMLD